MKKTGNANRGIMRQGLEQRPVNIRLSMLDNTIPIEEALKVVAKFHTISKSGIFSEYFTRDARLITFLNSLKNELLGVKKCGETLRYQCQSEGYLKLLEIIFIEGVYNVRYLEQTMPKVRFTFEDGDIKSEIESNGEIAFNKHTKLKCQEDVIQWIYNLRVDLFTEEFTKI